MVVAQIRNGSVRSYALIKLQKAFTKGLLRSTGQAFSFLTHL